jgi:hypothetical protein
MSEIILIIFKDSLKTCLELVTFEKKLIKEALGHQ